MKLDRAGIDHLQKVAQDMGFRTMTVETREDYEFAPKIVITFEQTREAKEEEPPSFKDVRVTGVTEEQAAEIAAKSLGKLRTLDD